MCFFTCNIKLLTRIDSFYYYITNRKHFFVEVLRLVYNLLFDFFLIFNNFLTVNSIFISDSFYNVSPTR